MIIYVYRIYCEGTGIIDYHSMVHKTHLWKNKCCCRLLSAWKNPQITSHRCTKPNGTKKMFFVHNFPKVYEDLKKSPPTSNPYAPCMEYIIYTSIWLRVFGQGETLFEIREMDFCCPPFFCCCESWVSWMDDSETGYLHIKVVLFCQKV